MTTLTPIVPEARSTPAGVASRRPSWDWFGLLLGAYAFLAAVAWSNRVFNWFTTPKAALALCVLGPGLVALIWLLTRRDRPAIAAAVFLGLAALSTGLADEPMMSLFGEYFTMNGLLFVALLLCLWALGRTARGRVRFVESALLAGAVVNAAVAWLQASTDLGVEGLALFEGRSGGLTGNPVFLAGLCSAGLWLALARERSSNRPFVYLLLAGFLAGAVELSGSRTALVVMLAIVAWFAVAHSRRRDWARAGFVVLAFVVGFAVSQVPNLSESSGAERVSADASSGLAPRIRLWQAALEGVVDRPLLGYGPGRSVAATTAHRSLTTARYEGPDVLYSDAHNFLVEELATTGVLGFAAFLGWLVLAGRRARGALAGFAVIGAITMLFEPQSLALTPLVLLAFGAAGADRDERALTEGSWLQSRLAVGVSIALIVVGAGFGITLIRGDAHYRHAVLQSSFDELNAAERLFPPWPQLAGIRAQFLNDRATTGGGRTVGRRAITAERGAISRDSDDPHWWYALGALEEQWGSANRSASAYREALRRNPWSQSARLGLFRLALRRDDRAAAARLRTKMCEVGPAYCPPRSALKGRPDPDPAPVRTPRPPAGGS
jgi:O-antigen ligase